MTAIGNKREAVEGYRVYPRLLAGHIRSIHTEFYHKCARIFLDTETIGSIHVTSRVPLRCPIHIFAVLREIADRDKTQLFAVLTVQHITTSMTSVQITLM